MPSTAQMLTTVQASAQAHRTSSHVASFGFVLLRHRTMMALRFISRMASGVSTVLAVPLVLLITLLYPAAHKWNYSHLITLAKHIVQSLKLFVAKPLLLVVGFE